MASVVGGAENGPGEAGRLLRAVCAKVNIAPTRRVPYELSGHRLSKGKVRGAVSATLSMTDAFGTVCRELLLGGGLP